MTTEPTWISLSERKPTEEDADDNGRVWWHVPGYNSAALGDWDERPNGAITFRSVPSSILAKQVRSDRSEIAVLTARIDALTKERDEIEKRSRETDRLLTVMVSKWEESQARCARLETALREADHLAVKLRAYFEGKYVDINNVLPYLVELETALGANDATPKPNEGRGVPLENFDKFYPPNAETGEK